MRVKKSDSEIEEGDTTPMIDIVFQLIAFFMVLVNFTEADQDQRVRLPTSELARPPESPPDNMLVLNIGQNETDRAAGNNIFKIYLAGRTYDKASLEKQLNREKDRIERQGDDYRDAVIIVRADKAAPTGFVQEVIQVCQTVGFEQFALRAEEEFG